MNLTDQDVKEILRLLEASPYTELKLTTDKISLELNAEVDGILHISAKEGDTVPIGEVIASIEETDAPAAAEAKEAPAQAPAAEPETQEEDVAEKPEKAAP